MWQISVEPATLRAKGSDWKHPKVPPQLQATPAEPPWSLTVKRCCLPGNRKFPPRPHATLTLQKEAQPKAKNYGERVLALRLQVDPNGDSRSFSWAMVGKVWIQLFWYSHSVERFHWGKSIPLILGCMNCVLETWNQCITANGLNGGWLSKWEISGTPSKPVKSSKS